MKIRAVVRRAGRRRGLRIAQILLSLRFRQRPHQELATECVIDDRAVGVTRHERLNDTREIGVSADPLCRELHDPAQLTASAVGVQLLILPIAREVHARQRARREHRQRFVVLAPDEPVREELLCGILDAIGRSVDRPIGRQRSRRIRPVGAKQSCVGIASRSLPKTSRHHWTSPCQRALCSVGFRPRGRRSSTT